MYSDCDEDFAKEAKKYWSNILMYVTSHPNVKWTDIEFTPTNSLIKTVISDLSKKEGKQMNRKAGQVKEIILEEIDKREDDLRSYTRLQSLEDHPFFTELLGGNLKTAISWQKAVL